MTTLVELEGALLAAFRRIEALEKRLGSLEMSQVEVRGAASGEAGMNPPPTPVPGALRRTIPMTGPGKGSAGVKPAQVEGSPKLGQTDISSPTVRRFVVSHAWKRSWRS